MSRRDFVQQILQQDPKEEEAEKARLLLLLTQKKLLMAQVAQQKAILDASPRVSSTGGSSAASPAPSNREALLTPTGREAIEAKKALLRAQIELKQRQLMADRESGQASQAGSASPMEGSGDADTQLEAKKRLLAEQIAQKQALLEDRLGPASGASDVEQSSSPQAVALNALSQEEIEAKKREIQAKLLQLQAKTASPLNGSAAPTEPQPIAAPALLSSSDADNAEALEVFADILSCAGQICMMRPFDLLHYRQWAQHAQIPRRGEMLADKL